MAEAQARRQRYLVLLAVGVWLLGVATIPAVTGTFVGLEQHVFSLINHVSAPDWVAAQVAKPLSNAVWGIGLLVVVLLAMSKFRMRAWQYAVAAGSAYTLTFVIEHVVSRARPAGLEGYHAVLRAMQGGPGFPSGHVAVITAIGLTIWPYVSWPWRALVVAFIVAEAWARVFLGVHAPLDVLGGFAVGVTVVALIHLTPGKIRGFFRVSA